MSTGPAASAASADVSSAPSELETTVGEMFGDFTSSGGETPEPDSTSAAGTTPAEPAAGTDTETPTPDAAAGDGAATAASDGTTPDTPPADAADAAAEADPFADTTPATFMVNGKPVTNEDIRVFKEGGAVIRPEALPNVLNRLSERESLFERNRAQSVEYQTLAKAIEWTDPNGKQFTGPEAAIEMRVGNAALFAENQLLFQTLTDPAKLAQVLAVEQVPDGKGGMRDQIVVDPAALDHLRTVNENQQMKLSAEIRGAYATVLAEASKSAPVPIDFTAETPKLIDAIAKASNLDASVLTPADRALLAKQLPRHIDKSSGKELASVEWQELVRDRIQLRTEQKASSVKLVDATTKAAKDGLNRMAAAARGVKPAAKPVSAPKPKVVQPQVQRDADEGALFDAMLSSSAAAMRAAR